MKIHRFLFLTLLGFALAHCALPTPERSTTFVHDKELSAVKFSRLGMAQMARGQFVEAELSFRQALYLYPQLLNLKQNLAIALAKQGQTEEAQNIFEELIRSVKNPLQIRAAQADMYYAAEEFDKSKQYYLMALALAQKSAHDDDISRINRSLAVLSFKRGFEEAALCYSQQAYALQPGSMDEAYRHVRMLIALNQFKQASELISAIALQQGGEKKTPLSEPRLLYLWALSEYARGNFAFALKNAASSIDLGASDVGLEAEATLLSNLARKQLGALSADEQQEADLVGIEKFGRSSALYFPPSVLDQFAAGDAASSSLR